MCIILFRNSESGVDKKSAAGDNLQNRTEQNRTEQNRTDNLIMLKYKQPTRRAAYSLLFLLAVLIL
jgi:hypothetical protein